MFTLATAQRVAKTKGIIRDEGIINIKAVSTKVIMISRISKIKIVQNRRVLFTLATAQKVSQNQRNHKRRKKYRIKVKAVYTKVIMICILLISKIKIVDSLNNRIEESWLP